MNKTHVRTFKDLSLFFRRFPNWQAIVKLRCDPSKKTPEEAEFYFISKDNNKWVSQTSNDKNIYFTLYVNSCCYVTDNHIVSLEISDIKCFFFPFVSVVYIIIKGFYRA